MCGIALILAGVRILGADPYRESGGGPAPDAEEVCDPVVLEDDLKAALLRRGPDNLGSRKLFLYLTWTNSVEKNDNKENDLHDENREKDLCLRFGENAKNYITPALKAASAQDVSAIGMKSVAELDFLGATLQLRGRGPVFQPLEDISGNVLVYNGEIFGGIHVADDSNDAEALLYALERCCSCDCHVLEMTCSCIGCGEKSVSDILSTIKGPWALIYWQERSKTIWFGRDAFGRRSLLVHWPTFDDSRFIMSSVSPPSFARKDSDSTLTNDGEPGADSEVADMQHTSTYWEELPCGIYSIHLKASKGYEQCGKKKLVGEVRKHKWTNPLLDKLIRWERKFLDPKAAELFVHGLPSRKGQPALLPCLKGKPYDTGDSGDHIMLQTNFQADTAGSLRNDLTQLDQVTGYTRPAQKLLIALRESVMRRTTLSTTFQTALHQCKGMEYAPIALLFSGGLDSMILAALLDQCLDPKYTIDLLNVSFDGHLAPDRISAKAGVRELQRIAPLRRWRLVEIDANLSNLTWETKHLLPLIHPARTYMDLNIGLALWLAAGGDGWVDGEICHHLQEDHGRYEYKSTARILLVGSGADEQCAGYGRHRTKYRLGGWVALQEEMRLDMQRIWKRNLGRDDRCISDHGKEARFPFLDEDVIRTLLEFPLWEIAELDEPVGRGDKKILREVARLLGLGGAAILPKRAIQFGSRIARESNRKNFGSNRAANQASAGSVEIHEAKHRHRRT